MRRAKPCIGIVLAFASATGPVFADPGPGKREAPIIAVVPFVNLSGDPDALPVVMQEVWARLETRGFRLVGNGRIEDFLRERRIRARNALSMRQALDLTTVMGARYLLVGTVDAWSVNGGPEVGLTARIVDPERGQVIWIGDAALHAVQAPGLLGMGRPKTLQEASRKCVRSMFATLRLTPDNGGLRPVDRRKRPTRDLLAERPVFYRADELDTKRRLKVAVLPLLNRTVHPEASAVITDRLVAWLLAARDVDVVDPGELRRVLIERRILPLRGLDTRQLQELGSALAVDAVVDGEVLRYENGHSTVPKIDVYVRLRDAADAVILWSGTTFRDGEQTRTLYDLGRIRGIDKLADVTVGNLLSTWLD